MKIRCWRRWIPCSGSLDRTEPVTCAGVADDPAAAGDEPWVRDDPVQLPMTDAVVRGSRNRRWRAPRRIRVERTSTPWDVLMEQQPAHGRARAEQQVRDDERPRPAPSQEQEPEQQSHQQVAEEATPSLV